jgi:hypothetical protein
MVGEFSAPRVEPGLVQFRIHLIGARWIALPPGSLERIEPFPPALGAWPVAGGERDGFVQKEKLGVSMGRHHTAVAAPEFQDARDPTLAFVTAHDLSIVVVQRAAAVAHEGPASRRAKQITERIHAVLQWHSKSEDEIARSIIPSEIAEFRPASP